MSYSQGGVIQATDYNNFIGTSPSSTANQINTIWAAGHGSRGYGQTALTPVSTGGTVTATQWASAINTLNSIYTHQTNSGTGITAPTTGALIAYLNTFSSSITTAYNNALTAATQGSAVTGSTYYTTSTTSTQFTAPNQAAASTFTITRTVTFPTGDAARYFFNAGGVLNFIMGSASNPGATNRGADLVTLISTNFSGMIDFGATSNGQRTGTGGSLAGGGYTSGYYGLTTSPQTIAYITSGTSPYTSDYLQLTAQTNGVQGSNADNGTVITFVLTIYSAARSTLPAPPANPVGTGTTVNNSVVNDSIAILTPHSINITPPESVNLSNTWGTIGSTIVVA